VCVLLEKAPNQSKHTRPTDAGFFGKTDVTDFLKKDYVSK